VTRLDYTGLGFSDSPTASTSSGPRPPAPVYSQQQPAYQAPAYEPPPNGYSQGYGYNGYRKPPAYVNQGYGNQGYANPSYGSGQGYGEPDTDYGGYDLGGSESYGSNGSSDIYSNSPATVRPPRASRNSTLQSRRPADLARLSEPAYADETGSYAGIGSASEDAGADSSSGDTITVQPGDTLFAISRRTGVPVADIMRANNLARPDLKIGQRLVLPSGSTLGSSYADQARQKPRKQASRRLPATALAAGGTYRVKAGDSLYGIAQRYGASPQALADANGIEDPSKIQLGQVLTIPSPGATAVAGTTKQKRTQVAKLEEPADSIATDDYSAAPVEEGSATEEGYEAPAGDFAAEPAVEPPEKKVKTASRASEPEVDSMPAGGEGKFRWPVKGRIIAKFGETPDGSRNEGINVAVPAGTEVKAAETGVVAYAGDELKGYGKLVLIRHADNWVTAYAHNSEILVKRGDSIRRGQVIAKAGKTGSVEQPQLHFELRKGSEPVDPMPHMASN
jgi:murein DD-endopeptidase MepM/ murein hydrolase activator NlpD